MLPPLPHPPTTTALQSFVGRGPSPCSYERHNKVKMQCSKVIRLKLYCSDIISSSEVSTVFTPLRSTYAVPVRYKLYLFQNI